MAARPLRRAAAAGSAAALALLVPLAPPAVAAEPAARLAETREGIARTSAELAALRTRADRLGDGARAETARLERRLQARKEALLRREEVLETAAGPSPAGRPGTDARAGAEAPRPAAGEPAGTRTWRPYEEPAAEPRAGAARDLPPEPAREGGGPLADRIDAYLASRGSPLAGLGGVFVGEARANGVEPRFLVAIAGAETSFGTYGPSQAIRNPFGMGPGIVYGSWAEAIGAAARNLAGGFYRGEGRRTVAEIQRRWAPGGAANDPTGLNAHWTRNVSAYLAELGGDPAAPVLAADAPAR